jgi:hypothetical protein
MSVRKMRTLCVQNEYKNSNVIFTIKPSTLNLTYVLLRNHKSIHRTAFPGH